jgi:plastocyanin
MMIVHNIFSILPCLLLGVALLLATPSSGEDISVDWFIPNTAALPSMTAAVGDIATFTWAGFHDVYVHPSGDCDETERILVGASTGATYTFTGADVGELVFACDVSVHCQQGLIVTFTVSAGTSAPTSSTTAPSKSPSATSAPSVTPTGGQTSPPTSQPTSPPTGGPTSPPSSPPTQAPSGAASIISQSSTTAAALMVCTTAFVCAGL